MYKRYSMKRALIFSLLIIVLTTIFRIMASIVYLTTQSQAVRSIMENSILLTFIMHLTCLIIPCFIYIYVVIPKGEVKETLRLNKFSFKNLMFVIGILLLFQPFVSLISYISSMFFNNVSAEILTETMSMPYILAVMFIGGLPAFSEELVFRGVVLSNCSDKHNLVYSMLNGLFFAALHGNFSQFFYAFFLGMLFYYIVKIANSLYLVMVAHFLVNGSQVTTMYILDMIDPAILNDLPQDTAFDLQVFSGLVFVTIVSLSIFAFIWSKFKKYNGYDINTI